MRKITLMLLLLLFQYMVSAQISLDSFYKQGTRWCEYYKYGTGFGNYTSGSTTYSVGQDTSINGKMYHVLYQDSKLIGGLRTDSNKVYFYADTASHFTPYTEFLLYNFNLMVGDSINLSNSYRRKIMSIDSVQLSNGVYVKRYHYDTSTVYPEYSLYGIGGQGGLFDNYYHFPPNRTRVYMASNFYYLFPDQSDYKVIWCFPTDIYKSKNTTLTLKIYPNPITDNTIRIQSSEAVKQFRVWDMNGKCIFQQENIESGEHMFTVSLSQGLYYADIVTVNGVVRQKLVKL
ncbi:MAG: T9SS type A sorting domain-containing protein [Bacteroidetes bacterium]|nr:T9SS type A sorting domain-containing protein [Bacteroidota bacterium]